MGTNELIDAIIAREGGYRNAPHDPGGRTDKGISERSHPDAWADGHVTNEEAREIYLTKYLRGPKIDHILDGHLQEFMLDYAVHSGPAVAIKALQQVLGVSQDGVMGPETINAINMSNAKDVQNSLVDARALMCARIVQRNPQQLPDLVGWLRRIFAFRRSS